MDLHETSEHRRFRADARAWLAAHVPEPLPVEDVWTLRDLEHRRAWARTLADEGWAGIDWPCEYGGRGLTTVHRAIWFEEVARAKAPDSFQTPIDNLGSTIVACGTEEQKKRYLRPMLRGDEVWAQGFSEPDAGSDLANIRTRAEWRDRRWIVHGQKTWTSYARWATGAYVLARTSTEASRYGGISYLLVPMDQAAVRIQPIKMISGDEDRFAELWLDGAEAIDVVGDVGDGWNVAMKTLAHERFTRSFLLWSEQRKALDDLLASVATRDLGAPIRQELARLESWLRVFRWTCLRFLASLADGRSPTVEGALLKLGWSEWNQRLMNTAMNLLGPEATISGSPWHNHFFYSRAETIFAGSSEIQRNVIGERGLGLPR